MLNGAGLSAALFDTGRIAMDDQQADIADGALGSCHGNFGEEPLGHAPRRSSRQGWRSHLRSPFRLGASEGNLQGVLDELPAVPKSQRGWLGLTTYNCGLQLAVLGQGVHTC